MVKSIKFPDIFSGTAFCGFPAQPNGLPQQHYTPQKNGTTGCCVLACLQQSSAYGSGLFTRFFLPDDLPFSLRFSLALGFMRPSS